MAFTKTICRQNENNILRKKICPNCGSSQVVVDKSQVINYDRCKKCGFSVPHFPKMTSEEIKMFRNRVKKSQIVKF
jgi:transcription elongation factor Elf1